MSATDNGMSASCSCAVVRPPPNSPEAMIAPPTCGPCFGGLAQLAAGDARISTSTRNDPGRMGSRDASIYLGSALTVTASAIAGRIADPRDYLPSHAKETAP